MGGLGAGAAAATGATLVAGGLLPRIKERTPALTGAPADAVSSFGLGPISVPKSRPKLCFAIAASVAKKTAGHNSFFAAKQRLDIWPGGIILPPVILTKVFLLKVLLGFGFGLIILALL
jgi:hypothetical protein